MPALIPVTEPVELIVPTERSLLLQVPPEVELLMLIILPTHTVLAPVITAGNGFTVTIPVV